MAYDTVIDKAVLEQGLTEMADLIRAELDMREPLPFPGMETYMEKAFTQKNLAIQQAKDKAKAFIERTETNIYNEDVARVSPFSHYHYDKLKIAQYDNAASAGESAFEECTALTSVSLPSAGIIGKATFKNCTALTTVTLPKVYEIRAYAFDGCARLESIDLPAAKTIGQYAFASCTALKSLDLHNVTSIPNHAFRKATNLNTLYLRNDSVVPLADVGAFYGVEAVNVYVPGSLIESYKAAGNWSSLFDAGVVSFLPIPGTEVKELISFTVDDREYQAEEGMTWAEWIESDYNIHSAYAYLSGNQYVVRFSNDVGSFIVANQDGGYVNLDDGIVPDGIYKELISFTVDGTEYPAEKGMTWAQWCDSPFNPEPGFEIVGDDLVWDRYLCEVYLVGGGRVKPSDTIQATEYYGLNV